MLKIYNLKDKLEYLKEVLLLEHQEWGEKVDSDKLDIKINKKRELVINNFDNPSFCKLILLDDKELIGFISLFPKDGDERIDLTPWYATMYVKKEYRGSGYSKILNNAILNEAKNRGFKRVYLKSNLENYYEKFGAIYLDNLKNGEKLYYIDVK